MSYGARAGTKHRYIQICSKTVSTTRIRTPSRTTTYLKQLYASRMACLARAVRNLFLGSQDILYLAMFVFLMMNPERGRSPDQPVEAESRADAMLQRAVSSADSIIRRSGFDPEMTSSRDGPGMPEEVLRTASREVNYFGQ